MSQLESAGAAWRGQEIGERVAVMARPHRSLGRRIGGLVAAAAAVMIGAGAVFLATRPHEANAMAIMGQKLRQAGTIQFRLAVPHRGMESGRFIVSGERMRVEFDSGDVLVMDGERREGVLIRPAAREVVRGAKPNGAVDFYGLFVSLADAQRVEEIGVAVIDGRHAEVFRANLPGGQHGLHDHAATVWLDAATRLPLRVEFPCVGANGQPTQAVINEFAFDVQVADALFDTEPPGFASVTPEATTPGIGLDMAKQLRDVGMAFHVYMQEHDGAVPESLAALTPKYLSADRLVSARRPNEPIGYVYVKPTQPLKYDAVLAYERFTEGSDNLWVLLVDSSVHMKTHDELRQMLGQ